MPVAVGYLGFVAVPIPANQKHNVWRDTSMYLLRVPCQHEHISWHICLQPSFQLVQAMLKRHGCHAISVPLGAYGAKSEWPAWTSKIRTVGNNSQYVTPPSEGIWNILEQNPETHVGLQYSSLACLLRKRVTLYTTAPYLLALGTKLDPLQRLGFTQTMHIQHVVPLIWQWIHPLGVTKYKEDPI